MEEGEGHKKREAASKRGLSQDAWRGPGQPAVLKKPGCCAVGLHSFCRFCRRAGGGRKNCEFGTASGTKESSAVFIRRIGH
jgi:hypothetical protein